MFKTENNEKKIKITIGKLLFTENQKTLLKYVLWTMSIMFPRKKKKSI